MEMLEDQLKKYTRIRESDETDESDLIVCDYNHILFRAESNHII